MHVTGMDHVDCRRSDNEAMLASIRRERREAREASAKEAEGVV
jgi:hypothetical protein